MVLAGTSGGLSVAFAGTLRIARIESSERGDRQTRRQLQLFVKAVHVVLEIGRSGQTRPLAAAEHGQLGGCHGRLSCPSGLPIVPIGPSSLPSLNPNCRRLVRGRAMTRVRGRATLRGLRLTREGGPGLMSSSDSTTKMIGARSSRSTPTSSEFHANELREPGKARNTGTGPRP